jgi:hypothetical protein
MFSVCSEFSQVAACSLLLSDSDVPSEPVCRWQRAQLPGEIRQLVLNDQRLRNEVCWYVLDC